MPVLRSRQVLEYVLFVLLTVALSGSSRARAESPDVLFDQHNSAGHQLSHEQKFAEAAREFEQAYKIKKDPKLALNLGRLYLRLKRLDLASHYCASFLSDVDSPPPELKQKADDCVTQARLVKQVRKPEVKGLTKPGPATNEPAVKVGSAEKGTGSGSTGTVTDGSQTTPQGSGTSTSDGVRPTTGNGAIVALVPTQPVSGARPLSGADGASTLDPGSPEAPEPPPAQRTTPSVSQDKPTVGNDDKRASPPVEAKVETTDDRSRKPVYKKWWFWTIVGVGVAGAAAGITAGVLSSRTTTSPTPDPDPLERFPAGSRVLVTF